MITKMIPSERSTLHLPRVNAVTYTSIADEMSIMKSAILNPMISKGEIAEDNPIISNALKMQEPSALPSANWAFPFTAAIMQVTSSGKDVPTATIVSDITASLIPH